MGCDNGPTNDETDMLAASAHAEDSMEWPNKLRNMSVQGCERSKRGVRENSPAIRAQDKPCDPGDEADMSGVSGCHADTRKRSKMPQNMS